MHWNFSKTDHKKVKELFKKAEGNKNPKQQKGLFEQIKTELETHTHIVEQLSGDKYGLKIGPCCLCEIAGRLPVSYAKLNVSPHPTKRS